jgi:hypothetical protein
MVGWLTWIWYNRFNGIILVVLDWYRTGLAYIPHFEFLFIFGYEEIYS